MKPNQEQIVNNQFSEHGRSQQMTFDPNSLAHIQRVLINLYSDPLLAVIREYSTNAFDSHVAAGKATVPFHVTTPNAFSSDFVIRDFGVGLSETEVFEIFGAYGASTKRESDDFVGQLGLGCKSALAVTNQFSLTTIKDGTKCIFSVHLDEFGVGKITKLHEEESDEETGVEVSIPIRDYRAFNTKVRRFFRTFPVIPIFSNESIRREELEMEVILEIDEKTKVVRQTHDDNGSDYIIMGGVAYPYRSPFRVGNNGTIIIEAPIGSVDFTPSREELQMTQRTKDFLEEAFSTVKENIKKTLLDEAKGCKTLLEHQYFISKNSSILHSVGVYKLSYDGIDVDVNSSGVVVNAIEYAILVIDGYSGKLKTDQHSEAFRNPQSWYSNRSLGIGALEGATIITGVTPESYTTYNRGRIKMYMQQNSTNRVIVTPDVEKLHKDYLAVIKSILTIDEVKTSANKYLSNTRNKNKNVYSKLTFAYSRNSDVKFDTSRETPDDNLTTVYAPRPVMISLGTHLRSDTNSRTIELFSVGDRQEKKFLELNPGAIRAEDYIIEKLEEKLNEFSKRDAAFVSVFQINLGYGNDLYTVWRQLPRFKDLSKIEDPKLRSLLADMNLVTDTQVKGDLVSLKNTISRLKFLEGGRVDTDALTILTDKVSNIGASEFKEFVALYEELRPVYPLLLEPQQSAEYLVQYVNLVSKGEQP